MKLDKLKEKAKDSGLSPTEIAAACGLSVQGWYNKLNGDSDMKVSEAVKLSKVLKLTQKEQRDIFLS